MSRDACRSNQKIAKVTTETLLERGGSVFTLEEHEVNRMLVCGSCPKYAFSGPKSKAAFRSGMEALFLKISRYNEWGADPEIAKIRSQERGRVWREENRELITGRNEDRRIEARIQQLLDKFGGES